MEGGGGQGPSRLKFLRGMGLGFIFYRGGGGGSGQPLWLHPCTHPHVTRITGETSECVAHYV